MKLSVVIPCYNFGEYIEQSILSVVSQRTNFDFEILVRDDMSSDLSQVNIERVSFFNPIVRYFQPTENLGASRNISFLLSQCQGDYVALLDGDDYLADNYKLQRQVDFLDQNPEYIMTFTGYWSREVDGSYLPSLPNGQGYFLGLVGFPNNEITTEHLLQDNNAGFGRVFRNTSGLIKDWMLDITYFDWCINYQLSKLGKIKYLDFPSGVYRQHSGGIFWGATDDVKFQNSSIVRNALRIDYDQWKNS